MHGNDVLSLAREKWPSVFDEEKSRRMLGFVKGVYAALEDRDPLNLLCRVKIKI